MTRFEQTYCSHCGMEFGPGDHGYSHCDQHPGYKRDQMLKRQAAARKSVETRRLNRIERDGDPRIPEFGVAS